MNSNSTIAVSIEENLQADLARLAALSQQTESAIIAEALAAHIAWRLPQMLDLQEAIDAADRGEFATDAEVNAVFTRYGA